MTSGNPCSKTAPKIIASAWHRALQEVDLVVRTKSPPIDQHCETEPNQLTRSKAPIKGVEPDVEFFYSFPFHLLEYRKLAGLVTFLAQI